MEDFIFHQGSIPTGYKLSFAESLFNKPTHRQLQAQNNWHSFFILNQTNKTVVGAIHFHLQNGIAQSPFKATHGGFDLYDEVQQEIVLGFVIFVEGQLQKLGATKIFIKLPLRISDGKKFNLVESILIKCAFQIAREEVGSIIKVSPCFIEELHRSEKKRLRKSINENFKFEKISLNRLESVYSFILRCRMNKQYKLSMSLQGIQDLALQFPDNVLLFVVMDNDRLAAASICILVNEKILYDFYHDHDTRYDAFSPIVFLVEGINDYCYEYKIPLIDLGTSMIGNKVNTTLFNFKLKLGGKTGVKYSFEKICV